MSFQLIHTFHKREKVAKRENYCYYCVNFFQDDTEHRAWSMEAVWDVNGFAGWTSWGERVGK